MSKPPILFIHGMWGSAQVWEHYSAWFEARGYETHALTLPHHETTIDKPAPQGIADMSLLDYAADILKTVEAYKTPPILIGHSMGGLLAQLVAAKTKNIHAVIALTPAPPAGVLALKPSTMKMFSEILLTPKFWKKPTKLSFKKARYGMYHNMSEADARAHYKNLRWESGKATREIAFWTLDKAKASRLDRSAIHCPVFLLSGQNDRTVNAGVVAASARRYKGKCDYEELSGHTHWLLGEQNWEDVAAKCAAWLENQTS